MSSNQIMMVTRQESKCDSKPIEKLSKNALCINHYDPLQAQGLLNRPKGPCPLCLPFTGWDLHTDYNSYIALRLVRNLPHRRSNNDSNKTKTCYNQRVWRWHLKNVFQEECVQLWYLPEHHQLTQCKKPHVSTCRIQPPYRAPMYWSKLQQCPFNLSRGRRNVPVK